MFRLIIVVSLLLTVLASCSLTSSVPSLHQSNQYYNYLQPSFDEYVDVTESWLRGNRVSITNEPEKELLMNMPFSLGNKATSAKAILLVHGLGDSPYSFSDIAKSLYKQGFYVQTLLLPGHGSKPTDLMLPSYSDWQKIVDHYANLLKIDFEQVWLGGYSTGGNLVTIHTIESIGIDGLMLFAPGFQSNIPIIEKLARTVSLFTDGVQREENNLVKYSSAVINGGIAYTDSASRVRALFEDNTITIPTFIAISEEDSAVDSHSVRAFFLKNFEHPNNKMIWYGNTGEAHDSIEYLSMKIDEQRITTGSHMSPLFSPKNPYYGAFGERRMCKTNYKKTSVKPCKKYNKELWYAAWGYQEEGKKHTRLTWNPYYTELEQAMFNIVNL